MSSELFFAHDFRTRHKPSVAHMLAEQKTRGYGLFWIIAEMLYESDDSWLPLNEKTYGRIAAQSGETVEYIQSFIELGISTYEIFVKRDDHFSTLRVLSHNEIMNDFKEKKKFAGRKSAEARALASLHKQREKGEQKATGVEHNSTGVEQKGNRSQHINTNTDTNTNTETDTEEDSATKVADALRLEYETLVKDKKSVWNFVKDKKPKFHEPYKDLWNFFAREKFKTRKYILELSDARKKLLSARLKEQAFDFCKIITAASKSRFLQKSNFFGFSWIIKNSENYLKILEGMYEDDAPAPEEKPMVR